MHNYKNEVYEDLRRDLYQKLDCDEDSKSKVYDIIIPQIKKNLESYDGDKPENWEQLFMELYYLLRRLMRTISKSNSIEMNKKLEDDYKTPLSLTNYYMPVKFLEGFPKQWRKTSEYAPYSMDGLQDDYKVYKSKPYLRCDYLDFVFLKHFIYGALSTDYFILLFRKGIPSMKYAIMEAMTSGNVFKIAIFKFIANIITLLFFFVNPVITYFSFSYGINWLGWIFAIFTGLSLISLPVSFYYYFKIKKWESGYEKKIEISFKAYDHINNININPEILKKIMTKNETDFNVFLETSVYAIVDDLIAKHKNYFDPYVIK